MEHATDVTDIALIIILAVAAFCAYRGWRLVTWAWRLVTGFLMGPPPMPRCYRHDHPPTAAQSLNERIAAAHAREELEHRQKEARRG